MEIYEFGAFQLSVAERCLFYRGQVVPLSAKLFDILLLLVQDNGNLVSKDKFIKTVWADTIVEENNLAVSISYIRKVLDKDRKGHSYIQTVSGHGYRFAAGVKVINSYKANHSIRDKAPNTDFDKSESVINSIAILPFENVSADSSIEYLSDGITESLIYSLSRLPELKVMARNTVFHYKGSKFNAQQIGHTLGVHAVLTGRLLQISDGLIISIELIDVTEGTQIWGEQYNRKLTDILDLQEEIVKITSEKLRLKISGKKEELLIKRYTNNTQAYEYYLRGRYFWDKYNEEGLKKSIEYFQRAIDIDANYALAYAGLADSYYRLSNVYVDPREALPKVKAAAMKAIEIDPELAESHSSLGAVKLYYDRNWQAAEAEYKRAIEIAPGHSFVHTRYGCYLMYSGRFDEALIELKLAQELDPLSLQINMCLGSCWNFMGHYEQAVNQLQKTLELEPNYFPANLTLGMVYTCIGQFQEAIAILKKSFQIEEHNYSLALLGYTYAISGEKKEAERILMELKKKLLQEYVSPYDIAIIYTGLGKKDQAFEWLEKLFDESNEMLVWLKISPELKNLRSDARFDEILKRVGFP